MQHYTPRLVWVDTTATSGRPMAPRLGFLLDWKRVCDDRGVPQWYGLVWSYRGGGELPWHGALEWIWDVHLAPAEVVQPRH